MRNLDTVGDCFHGRSALYLGAARRGLFENVMCIFQVTRWRAKYCGVSHNLSRKISARIAAASFTSPSSR